MADIMELMNEEGSFYWYFKQISSIPRGSYNNKAISDYLVEFANEHGLKVKQDEKLNIIISKDASEGYEDCKGIVIQGHMDMVCEKKSGSDHDFFKDGLKLCYENGFVFAKDTTLGADDGIAVAYALAILADDSLIHPAIEVIITTDEEVGMDGAFALDTSGIKGKYMLNLDSEDEGIFLTSCAGGLTAVTKIPMSWNEAKGEILTIKVSGLTGGHSGSEIDKNRSNANIVLGRVLNEIKKKYFRINLCEISGGNKDNAIPRVAVAKLVVDDRMSDITQTIENIKKIICEELRFTEPGLDIECHISHDNVSDDSEEMWNNVMSPDCETHVIRYLMIVCDGIVKMSGVMKGLVESSLNLGVLETKEDGVYFTHSIRSSIESAKKAVFDKVNAAAYSCGGQSEQKGEYPGWEYNENSFLRNCALNLYEKLNGKKGFAQAIHAGLECGVLKSKIPDIDIIAYGPDILDIHTTEERMNVASAKRVYDFTVELIKELAQKGE